MHICGGHYKCCLECKYLLQGILVCMYTHEQECEALEIDLSVCKQCDVKGPRDKGAHRKKRGLVDKAAFPARSACLAERLELSDDVHFLPEIVHYQ